MNRYANTQPEWLRDWRTLYHAGYVTFVAVIGRMGDVVMAANQAMLTLEAMCWL